MTKSRKSFIVSILAALLVAFCATGAGLTEKANAAGEEKFSTAYINLSDDITLYFGLENLDTTKHYNVTFTFLGEQTTMENIPVSEDGEANVPFALVTPKYLDEEVKAELFVAGEEVSAATKSYTVKEYLYGLLSSAEETLSLSCKKYSSVKTLAVDMLNYGAAAQKKYLEEYTAVTDELSDAQKKYASKFEELPSSVDDRTLTGEKSDEYSWVSAGIRFDYNVSLYFVIEPKNADADLKVKVGDDVISDYETEGGARKYRYTNLSVLDFDKTLDVNVVNAAGEIVGQTLSYSVNGYVYAKQNDDAMSEIVKAVYNYGVSAKNYASASNTHSYKLVPEYGTDYTSAEATLGQWLTCEHCGKKTYTQYATAVNASGNTKTTENGPYEYVYVGGDRTKSSSYEKKNTRVNLASTSYNVGQIGTQTYSFKVTATAGKAKIIIRARNTNQNGTTKVNEEYALNKTLTLTVNGTAKAIPSSVVLKESPEIDGGAVFDEYVLSLVDLTDGENTIVLTFAKESNDSTGKPRGVYFQYMRLETVESCNGVHDFVYFDEIPADYYTNGMKAHYECIVCGSYFNTDKVETTAAELEIDRLHVFDVCEKVDGNTHSKTCIICGETVTENHSEGGARTLVVAKRPNRVWYYEGETLKDKEEDVTVNSSEKHARMQLYTTTLCADGCGDLTAYTGEYTVTYRHGDAFTEGDTYVTLTAVVGENEYTGILDGLTVVKTAEEMLNIDDPKMTVDTSKFNQRGNDQGGIVGQSAYGGYYLHEIKTSVTLTFNSVKTAGRLTVQASNNNPGTSQVKTGIKINGQIEIYVNGKKIEIDDTKVLHGTVGKIDARWAWTVWETVDLGIVEFNEGENTIEIRNINKSTYALVDIDCFNIFY